MHYSFNTEDGYDREDRAQDLDADLMDYGDDFDAR